MTNNEKSRQSSAFISAARKLGCDDDEEAFDKILKKIAKAPPPDSVAKRKGKPKKPSAKRS